MSVKNKVVIVTGASRGIGKVIAHSFSKEGANLVLVGRSKEALEKVEVELKEENPNVISVIADVTNEEQVKHMAEKTIEVFGKIDVLVNNAGTAGPTTSVKDLAVEDFRAVLDNNLTSTFLCIKAVVPNMMENQSGRIINLSSVSGKRALPYRVGYCAAKMGVIGLTRTLAAELGEHNITVNAICPGFVEGDRIDSVISNQGKVRGIDKEEVERELKSSSPLKRFVKPEEIAKTAVFLSTDTAIGITGEDVNVSSGVVMY
ncbi:SDR family NAD(P)-dependent oxidoreductase [Peribacillus asahii]|uniref:SDR family NAD(P)-dependent oxidoreductase n=1 Tax=Peribacillus asahii TaxID=228899 RepID=UPI0037F772F3